MAADDVVFDTRLTRLTMLVAYPNDISPDSKEFRYIQGYVLCLSLFYPHCYPVGVIVSVHHVGNVAFSRSPANHGYCRVFSGHCSRPVPNRHLLRIWLFAIGLHHAMAMPFFCPWFVLLQGLSLHICGTCLITPLLPPSVCCPLLIVCRYVNDMEHALLAASRNTSAGNYSQFLDVPAAIDYFLVTEITKNPDGFRGSVKMSKDRQGPIVMGPVWVRAWQSTAALIHVYLGAYLQPCCRVVTPALRRI